MKNHRNHKKFKNTNIKRDISKSAPNKSGSYGVLPAPGILESYEEIAPGSVQKIIAMATSEQEHRHKWENNYLKVTAYNNRVGQLLAFILAIIIIYASVAFVMSHHTLFACALLVVGFLFLIALTLGSCSRKVMRNPKINSDHNNKKHR
jgi:uncharacterized membrane protein